MKGTVSQVYVKSVLKTFENFGLTCQAHCEFIVARRSLKLLAIVQLKELGGEHVDVARTYNNLGVIHKNLGDFDQAKEYYQRTLSHLSSLVPNMLMLQGRTIT